MTIVRTRGLRSWLSGLLLVFGTQACSAIHVESVPTPYAGESGYGRVITEIRIDGDPHTRANVILDALASRVGDRYDRAAAEEDDRRLRRLGVFATVRFTTEPRAGGIVLVIHVTEGNRVLPLPSIALTEENGLEVGPAFLTRNLFGRAGRATGYARWGGATNYGLGYWDAPRKHRAWYACCYHLRFAHRERRNDLDDFDERSDDVEFQWLYFIDERVHVGPRLSFVALSEADTATSPGTSSPVLDASDGRDELPGLGVVVEYDSRNLIAYPTRGWYAQFALSRIGGPIGGPADYGEVELDLRAYHELAPRHSLAFYNLTTLAQGVVGRDVPVYRDFSIGGTNSVRGWPLDSRRGKNQWLTTAEYWWRIMEPRQFRVAFLRWVAGLQVAAFVDAGTAWNERAAFAPSWIGGGGVGLRVSLPQTGLLRFDVAVGKTHPTLDIQFHLGGAEKAVLQRARVR